MEKPELKSHQEIGKELDLFFMQKEVGSGLPLFTPKGATIKRIMERFITDEELNEGYEFTSTPIMAKSDLYKISGHWEHYQDSMFILNVGNETFALRPMTCPFQFMVYKHKPRSYKELPIKYAEISSLFRNEQSGELMGLTRVRQFTLADAHIICKPEQLEDEFEKVLRLVEKIMKIFKIDDVWYRFSKWDPKNKEKYIDNPDAWENSQATMKKILDKLKVKYVEADNEAAFYGPKLDIQFKNIFGKEDTLITIQIDFALPERFKLKYIGEDSKEHTPMIIHRSSIGCIERTLAYLLEKTQGKLPLWLSPIQVKIANFTDRNIDSCKNLAEKLKEKGIRAEVDFDATTMNSKVMKFVSEKVPYMVVIGDKEEKENLVSVRKRGERKVEQFKQEDFIKNILKEIEGKK
ncbi:MAG: threonine--tRNA ligase [Nanoarchaeota archaeon]|nr:threonine--tRNA ligase [Nanoarchaeota archaeon]